MGARGLSSELIRLLGRLKYRFSYGENVLQHSIEVGRIAGMIAAEIGANIEVAKIGATIVLGGVKGKNSNLSLDSDKILFKELNIKGVYSQGYKAYEESLRILEESKFDFSKMKTHEFSLTNAEKAIKTLYEEESEEAICVHLNPNIKS